MLSLGNWSILNRACNFSQPTISKWAFKDSRQNVLNLVSLISEKARMNAATGSGNGSGACRQNNATMRKGQGNRGQSGTQYYPPIGSLRSCGWRGQRPEAGCPGADLGHPHPGARLLPRLLARPSREADPASVLLLRERSGDARGADLGQ